MEWVGVFPLIKETLGEGSTMSQPINGSQPSTGSQSITGHFDGNVIVPDEPLKLPVGQRVEMEIRSVEPQTSRFADLAQFAADLPDAPSDLASQHDHYLYGTPKQ